MQKAVDTVVDNFVYPLLRKNVVQGDNLDRFLQSGAPCVKVRFNAKTSRAILFVHGNATRTSELRPWLTTLSAHAHCDAYAVPYAGYDSGVPTGGARGIVLDNLNVSTVSSAVRELMPERGTCYDQVCLVAHSMGCALALQAMPLCSPSALVLVAPFASLKAVATDTYGCLGAKLCPNRLNNVAAAQSVSVPTLLMHGMMDTVVPPRHSSQLFEQLSRSPRRERVIIPTANHELTPSWALSIGQAVLSFMPPR